MKKDIKSDRAFSYFLILIKQNSRTRSSNWSSFLISDNPFQMRHRLSITRFFGCRTVSRRGWLRWLYHPLPELMSNLSFSF